MGNRSLHGSWSRVFAVTIMSSMFITAAGATRAQDETVHPSEAVEDVAPAETLPPEPPPPPPVATDPPPVATDPPPVATDPPPVATDPPPVATDPPPVATDPPPVATDPPQVVTTEMPVTVQPTDPVDGPTESTVPVDGTETSSATETPTPSPTPTPTPSPMPTLPPPAALGLPGPYPGNIGADPSGDLSIIWGYLGFGVSQEYGRTAFSLANPTWYDYGADYGLDGVSHPGLDVSMPRGTWLFSPVNGTVIVSGNSAGFTFYGNGNPGVGELRIRATDGNEVILGHMGRIAVSVGDTVAVGQFVGVAGGFNGDHLHLEARHYMGGWFEIVDPRGSFLIGSIAAAASNQAEVGDDGTATSIDVAQITPVPLGPDDLVAATGGRAADFSITSMPDESGGDTADIAVIDGSPALAGSRALEIGQSIAATITGQVPEPEAAEDSTSQSPVELAVAQEAMSIQVAVLATRVTNTTLLDERSDPGP